MALGAWQDGVATNKGKIRFAVGVGGEQGLPLVLFVAALASLTQVPAMRIPMTTDARHRQRCLEIRCVAGFAVEALMTTLQRESGWSVVEAGGGPRGRHVTKSALGLRVV